MPRHNIRIDSLSDSLALRLSSAFSSKHTLRRCAGRSPFVVCRRCYNRSSIQSADVVESNVREWRSDTESSLFKDSRHYSKPPKRKIKPDPWAYHEQSFYLETRSGSAIVSALKRGDPDGLLRLFLTLSTEELRSVRELPTASYHELLRLLDPRYSLDPYCDFLSSFPPRWHEWAQSLKIENIARLFINRVRLITDERRATHPKASFFERKFMLSCANSAGDGNFGTSVWNAMRQQGIMPDSECCYYYLSSLVGTRITHTIQRQRIRCIPHFIQRRRDPETGYSTKDIGGVRDQVLEAFAEFRALGIEMTEKLYATVLLGFSRVKDFEGMSAVLSEAWSIRIEPNSHKLHSDVPVKLLSTSSSLHPTSFLLQTIVKAYGASNNLPSALNLVDFISRNYPVTLDVKTWESLLEWQLVLSVHKTTSLQVLGEYEGKLPLASGQVLWKAMIAPPYNITPTVAMRNRFSRILSICGRQDLIMEQLEESADELWRGHIAQTLPQTGKAYAQLQRILGANTSPSLALPSLSKIRRELFFTQRTASFYKICINRWIRMLLTQNRISRHRTGAGPVIGEFDYTYRFIPALVNRWREFMPGSLRYRTPTGNIEFSAGNEPQSMEERSPAWIPRVTI